MEGYNALVAKEIVIVVQEDFKNNQSYTEIPLDMALMNIDKPFMTFGLPKKIKRYVEKKAYSIIKKPKSAYPNILFIVQCPIVGKMIDSLSKNFVERIREGSQKSIKEWFNEGCYVMTLEEAEIYRQHFDCVYDCMEDEPLNGILNSLGIKHY